MIRNIRNRFPAARWMRIVGWTTVTMAWVTAVITRVAAAPPAGTGWSRPRSGHGDRRLLVPPCRCCPARDLSSPLDSGPTPEPEVIVAPAPAGGATPTATVSSGS